MNNPLFRLTDVMPIFKLDKTLTRPAPKKEIRRKKRAPKPLSFIPSWVEDKIKLGNLGENIANIYLSAIHGDNVYWVSCSNDSAGYDFIVGEQVYEAKTIKRANGKAYFYMSIKEIETCLHLKKEYNILFVQLKSGLRNVSAESISLFLFDGFYKYLETYKSKIFLLKESVLGDGGICASVDNVLFGIDIVLLELKRINYSFSSEQVEWLKL